MNAIYQHASSTEQYLDLGLRDQWYPVLASWEVSANPVGITRLGENIVVWRDEAGQLYALEDRCPHRGARLSLGWNLGDRVACWYHGVEVGEMVWLQMYLRCMNVHSRVQPVLKAIQLLKSMTLFLSGLESTPMSHQQS